MTPKQIIEAIKAERPEINTLFFVGCGASSAEQYPAQYFMDCNARKIRKSFYTANEFNYATPVSLDETAIVIACSLGGTTPETVAAAKLSQEKGAKVIAVTHDGNSPLAKNADYVIVHGFEKDYAAKLEKMNNILMLAVEVLNQYEGYDHYEDMVKGSENIYAAIEDAVSYSLTPAKAFAEAYKDSPVIYVMSSGATQKVAYSFSICLLMEMQWINSSAIHSDEFFNGPFEITEKDTAYLMLKSTGATRAVDERALRFLSKFNNHTTVLDGYDYGMKELGEVSGYFDHDFYSELLDVYNNLLADRRQHPLSWRKYMWKFNY